MNGWTRRASDILAEGNATENWEDRALEIIAEGTV